MDYFDTSEWYAGINHSAEEAFIEELNEIFSDFLDEIEIDSKTARIQSRYLDSLNSFGEYLVAEAFSGNYIHGNVSSLLILDSYVDQDEVPWIYVDDEAWQEDFDVVCRKFYKFYLANRNEYRLRFATV